MQIVRHASFKTTPWKNGGGTTHEAIRVPPQGSHFRWRVSVAHIVASGPFSDFAGYNRKMVLLRGSGVSLTFGDGRQTVLREVGELVEFSGALALDCQLLNGPCTDLNLIVSDSMTSARAWVERLTEPRTLETPRETLLVFSITDILSLEDEKGATTSLEPWDLAVLAPGDRVVIGPLVGGEPTRHGNPVDYGIAAGPTGHGKPAGPIGQFSSAGPTGHVSSAGFTGRGAVAEPARGGTPLEQGAHSPAGRRHPPLAAPLVFLATLLDDVPDRAG